MNLKYKSTKWTLLKLLIRHWSYYSEDRLMTSTANSAIKSLLFSLSPSLMYSFSFYFLFVLVCLDCCKKIPCTGSFINRRYSLLTVLDAGHRLTVWWGLNSLQMTPSVCPHMGEGTDWLLPASSIIPFMRALPHDLVTSQRPHLLIPLHWGLDFELGVLEGHTHSDLSTNLTPAVSSFPHSYLQCQNWDFWGN
jgi:hypothetical protein